MIQRKQTLYLLAALITTILCLALPLGSIEPKGMGISPVLFNLGLHGANGTFDFSYIPLFILLVVTCPIAILAILVYNKRRLQAGLCFANIIICAVWYLNFGFYWVCKFSTMGAFHPNLSVALPLISIILYVMARQGVQHDERLVKAADRIR